MSSSGRFLPSARIIAALTLASRVLGLLRECIFGYFFSTSEVLSAFRIAFMVPNLARRLFGEGALSAATIPTLTEHLRTHGEEASRRFVGTLLTLLTVVLVATVLAAEAVIGLWRTIQDDLALELTALALPYMILICAVAVAGAVLNVRRRFAVPAGIPIIMNVCIILGTLGGAGLANLDGVALMRVVCGSVIVAGVVQVVVAGLALRAISFFPRWGGRWGDPQVRAVVALMAPMILGLSAVQLNTLADFLIAYLFVSVDGQRVGPAVLGYAHYLYQLPLGVFGISLATAVYPLISQKAAAGDKAGMAEIVERSVRLAAFVALPASVGLMFVARPLVAAVYERGEFGPGDTDRVAGTLFFYSIGLVAYFIQHIVIRAFYALRDSKTPARTAACMVGVNLAMNLGLVFVLEERGLALATSLCAMIQVIWLSVRLSPQLPDLDWTRMAKSVARALVATGIMAGVLTCLSVAVSADRPTELGPLTHLAVLVAAGVATYGLAAWLLRIEELRGIFR